MGGKRRRYLLSWQWTSHNLPTRSSSSLEYFTVLHDFNSSQFVISSRTWPELLNACSVWKVLEKALGTHYIKLNSDSSSSSWEQWVERWMLVKLVNQHCLNSWQARYSTLFNVFLSKCWLTFEDTSFLHLNRWKCLAMFQILNLKYLTEVLQISKQYILKKNTKADDVQQA